ncbi:unnamed protein product, partial [Brassica rapa subsp. narinosa]
IWLLFFQSGSVWVAWFKTEILSGNLSNFWTLKPNRKYSWLTNKLIKMRDVMFTWIKLKIESGRDCRFWTDNWYPEGKICELMTGGRRTRLGIRQDATIASLYDNGHWLLPPARSENQVSILAFLSGLTISTADDFYVWEIDGIPGKRSSTGFGLKEILDFIDTLSDLLTCCSVLLIVKLKTASTVSGKSTQQLVHSSSNYGFLLVILPSSPLDCSILRLLISHQTFPNPFWAKLQWVS